MIKLSKLFIIISSLFIIQSPYLLAMHDESDSLTLHPRVLSTDNVWWNKGTDTLVDNKTLSPFTLNKLDERVNRFLQTHVSFQNSDGGVCEESEDVGEYFIYLSRYLGYGDAGAVYLCEEKSTHEFFAAKSGGVEPPRLHTERFDLKALDRLKSVVSLGKRVFYIQPLVDGVDFSSHFRIIPCFQQTEEQRILIAYNFLKELEYLCRCGVDQEDINSQNTMIDKNGHVFFVDFGGYGLQEDDGRRSVIDINTFKMHKIHVSMLLDLWFNVDLDSENLESPYTEFIQKIRPKKSLRLGPTLEMLSGLMKENKHPMILKVKLSEN